MNGMFEKIKISSNTAMNVKRIFEMPNDEFKSLVKLLEDIPPIRSRGDLLRALTSNDRNFSRKDLISIIDLLIYLDSSSREFEIDFNKYIDEMLISISNELSVVGDIKDRLILLHSRTKCISLVSKAMNLWSELPRKFNKCRILSDIRPIFADGLGDIPADGITVHTLILNFTESGEEKSFHVNLDENGLNKLEEVINRARAKQNLNEQLMNQAGVKMVRLYSHTQ